MIPEVYDENGKKLDGYVGIADGYLSDVVKSCEDMLDHGNKIGDMKVGEK